MAKETNGHKALVDNWAKSQAKLEAAAKAADEARSEAGKHSKAIYEALGTAPFYVEALGKSYRAMHKPARKSTKDKPIAEQYNVIPLPDLTPKHSF